MYRKKVITISLAIIAIVTAVSLVTASGSGIVTLAFASKKGSDPTGTSSNKKDTFSTGGSSTSSGSKSKFIKCLTGIPGSPSRTEVDNCWDKVFGGSASSSGSGSSLTLGASTSSGSSSSSLVHKGTYQRIKHLIVGNKQYNNTKPNLARYCQKTNF